MTLIDYTPEEMEKVKEIYGGGAVQIRHTLTQDECDIILDRLSSGDTVEKCAQEFNTDAGVIDNVRRGVCRLDGGGIQTPLPDKAHQQFTNRGGNKCSDEEIDEIQMRYEFGESLRSLARDFSVGPQTIERWMGKRGAHQGVFRFNDGNLTNEHREVQDFLRRVHRLIIRSSPDREYTAWKKYIALVDELFKEGKLTKLEASVTAAKKFPVAEKAFKDDKSHKKYDIDKKPLMPVAKPVASAPQDGRIVNENIDMTYRENLAWAVKTIGREQRTGERPKTCPNDTAFWLYEQAKKEPKEFLTKVNNIEAKNTSKEDEKERRKSEQRSIDDLDMMLKELRV